MTDGGAVLVAFFAEYPEGKVVDGSVLARAVDDNSDDISDAVRTVCRANLFKFTGFTMLRSLYNSNIILFAAKQHFNVCSMQGQNCFTATRNILVMSIVFPCRREVKFEK